MGFFQSLKEGLKKTRDGIMGQIDALFKRFKKVDEELFEELEELLIAADVGMLTSEKICDILRDKVKETGTKDRRYVAETRHQAVGHPCDRRQRRGQDHHHRQAVRRVPQGGQEVRHSSRRHLPGGGDRPARGMG